MRSRSSEQEDYLFRIIRQAAEALRRLREMLTGSAEASETVRRDASIAIDVVDPIAAVNNYLLPLWMIIFGVALVRQRHTSPDDFPSVDSLTA